MTAFFFGLAVKIPQLEQLEQRVTKLETSRTVEESTNRLLLISMEKNLSILVTLERDDRQKILLEKMINELNERNIEKIQKINEEDK